MFKPKLKLLTTATLEKTRPGKPFFQVERELTEEQLEARW